MIDFDPTHALESLKQKFELSRLLMLVSAVSLIALIAIPIRRDVDPLGTTGTTLRAERGQASEAIRSYLLRYRRAILPFDQSLIINEMRPHKQRFGAEMNRVLSAPTHPFVREAILISRSLGIESAKPHLLKLAAKGPERISLLAFRAGEQIAPSSSEDLGKLLLSDRPALIIEVLATLEGRTKRPVDAILQLLGHKDKEVREAALACVPPELTPEQILALKVRVDESDERTRPTALRALAKIKVTAQVLEWCLDSLRREDPQLRLAALEVLLARQGPLKELGPIWERLESVNTTRLERAFCCQLLERAGEFPRQRLRGLLPSFGPWELYFAARALIAIGDRKGIGVLLDLLERRPTLPAASEVKLRELVSNLLVEVSGLPLSAGISRWSRWYELRQRIAPRLLRPLQVDVREFVEGRNR